ncbi:LOW QUALITY PROTEIN: hypothetical protein ACHAXR_005360, partial [Thalassiosira sp. AJA248-18]
RLETWRSPPTYFGGEEFVWPAGWIEVQRLAEMEAGDDGDVGKQQQQSRQWIREFHPPYRAGHKGKKKICHSIEEVQKYIKQRKAKQLKEERLAARESNSPRRHTGRRKSYTSQSQLSSSLPREGTQSELNKLMKQNNKLSEKIRWSILYGAVLARKKGILESDSGFLGANGRMYPDLRKAFGKHVDVKQCSLCKSRVQGHWFCRITHGHLDKPDYDGGNSAECLIELFRCSVEELEEKLWALLPGGKKKKESRTKKGFESEEWSMNVLSEDLLYMIASFLPSLSQLASFCKTSKRGQYLLHCSVHSEKLFRGVFLRTFGEQGTRGNFEQNLSWRERWFMIRDLRRGLVEKSLRPPTAVMHQLRETVGILHPQEEREAIFYDNPSYADLDRAQCNGYFGMEILHLPRPPNAGPDWQSPIVLSGDFNGIRVFTSLSELFYERSPGGDDDQHRFLSVGDDEGGGQVLSLIHCDLDHTLLKADQGEGCPPCCFIGYASGRVSALSATLTSEGDKYDFAITGRHHAHDSEVTALTFVDCSSSPGCDVPVLFSACCAGKVYYYPNALNAAKKFSLEQSVLAFSNFYDCPIFSMASTVIHSQGQPLSVLCTGDRDGNIRIWLKPDDDLKGLCTPMGQKFRHIQLYKSSTHRGTGYHLVTRAKFIRNNLLITGTNNGDVRFWQLQCVEDPTRSIGKGPLPSLTLRYDLMGIHNGAVELLMNVGDVLLSSGGNDGKIVGWDISTGLRLGSIRCHPGRQIEEGGNLCCGYVDE